MPRTSWAAQRVALRRIWDVLAPFVLVVGGIYADLFSLLAAAVGAGGPLALTAAKGAPRSECSRRAGRGVRSSVYE